MTYKESLIARVVPGRSFIDVGGLWGIFGEQVSNARRYGATDLALLDETPLSEAEWQTMREHLAHNEVEGVEFLSGDVMQKSVRPYDVVHSSGVLYHLPNPLVYLARLRSLARRYLVLASAVFPASGIENEAGSLHLPEAGALFVPALDDKSRAVMSAYWSSLPVFDVADGTAYGAVGLQTECEFDLDDYVPFWWLPTPKALEAMCTACGFRVLEGRFDAEYSGYTALLE